ncbi:MAG: phosphatidylglycerophosphatase A [Candidatus Kapabacteria bacterium]|nr:phosphatidylglycerophosphatase A [Candidatus Kapabacteria bacterium]
MAANTIPRPKLSGVADYVATVGGIGLLPIMPGSWCSIIVALPALFVSMTVETTHFAYATASIVFALAGLWAIPKIQGKWGHDPSVVVIDEALGMSVTFIFPAASMGWAMWACSLFLFRLFDVMKPWPISAIDRRTESWAVLGDDLLAGVLAGISVQLLATALMAIGIVDPRYLLHW